MYSVHIFLYMRGSAEIVTGKDEDDYNSVRT
jgi:hypothetical protein